jgi:hypothetical protein
VVTFKRRVGGTLLLLGIDPRRLSNSLRYVAGYVFDLYKWWWVSSSMERARFHFRFFPVFSDRYTTSGVAKGHYFHQDLWAARLIFNDAPERHLDVGSRIDGFVSHLLCFRSVEVLDIRNLESRISGLRFRQADVMSAQILSIEPVESVSCLHVLEHLGLGRYGDPIAVDGWRTGMRNLSRLVVPGGRLYLSVPVGRPAVEFNAHRIFRPQYIIDEAGRNDLRLREFACVDDEGNLSDIFDNPNEQTIQAFDSLDYGCGLFLFERAA